jgi:hypothetical protein
MRLTDILADGARPGLNDAVDIGAVRDAAGGYRRATTTLRAFANLVLEELEARGVPTPPTPAPEPSSPEPSPPPEPAPSPEPGMMWLVAQGGAGSAPARTVSIALGRDYGYTTWWMCFLELFPLPNPRRSVCRRGFFSSGLRPVRLGVGQRTLHGAAADHPSARRRH